MFVADLSFDILVKPAPGVWLLFGHSTESVQAMIYAFKNFCFSCKPYLSIDSLGYPLMFSFNSLSFTGAL